MVAGHTSTMETATSVSPRQSASSSLKFGMDRILASDFLIDPSIQNGEECDGKSRFLRCRSPYKNIRYIPLGDFHPSFVSHSICMPQPIRPFTNVVMQAETHSDQCSIPPPQQKRKRSWSRAVFSNLQRKGLEKRFQLQKYITKPDRRQLAATLGLTDAQVKVWFQNRRMKWRHAKEGTRDDMKSCEVKSTPCIAKEITLLSSTNVASDSDNEIDIQTVDAS